MIDNFLQELFGPDTGGGLFSGKPGGDDSGRLMDMLKGLGGGGGDQSAPMLPMGGGGPTDSPYPMAPGAGGGGMDLSARAAPTLMPGGGDVPLPTPRPAEAPQGGAPAPMLPDQAMAMLRGPGGVQVPEGMPQGGGNLFGINPAVMKRLGASLAGGMAGGDPAFKGGAFMKGMSGSLSGGLKSDKEDKDAATAGANTAFKNNIATQDLARKTKQTDALTALYGARTKATTEGKPSSAWNKPPHERLKDAERLIIDKGKQLYNGINPLLPKDQRDAAKKAADGELADFKKRIYKQYGFDQNGSEIPGAGGGGGAPGTKPLTPSTSKVVGDQEGEDSGLYEPAGKMVGTGSSSDPYVPQSKEHFDALPPGAIFINPADGKTMRKSQKSSALEPDDTGVEATA